MNESSYPIPQETLAVINQFQYFCHNKNLNYFDFCYFEDMDSSPEKINEFSPGAVLVSCLKSGAEIEFDEDAECLMLSVNSEKIASSKDIKSLLFFLLHWVIQVALEKEFENNLNIPEDEEKTDDL